MRPIHGREAILVEDRNILSAGGGVRGLPSGQDYAYQYLRQRILTGEFAGGERIKTKLIAEALGLSPMPVREALRQLSAEGLVTIYPRRGVTVTALDAPQIQELSDIRAVLEGLAVRRAHSNFSAADFSILDKLLHDMEVAENDPLAWFDRHNEFHEFLCVRSRCPILISQIRNIKDRFEPYLRLFLRQYDAEMPGAEHRTLLNVIKGSDSVAAESAMRHHISSAAEAIVEIVNGAFQARAEPSGAGAEGAWPPAQGVMGRTP